MRGTRSLLHGPLIQRNPGARAVAIVGTDFELVDRMNLPQSDSLWIGPDLLAFRTWHVAGIEKQLPGHANRGLGRCRFLDVDLAPFVGPVVRDHLGDDA